MQWLVNLSYFRRSHKDRIIRECKIRLSAHDVDDDLNEARIGMLEKEHHFAPGHLISSLYEEFLLEN